MADLPPVRKFMFDKTFEEGSAARVPERKPVTLKPEQYDALKKEAFDQGVAAGRQAGADEQAKQIASLVARVDEKLGQMAAGMQKWYAQQDGHIREIVVAIARKILPEFTAAHGIQEIHAVLSEVIGEMVHEPRLVVRVNENQFDILNERIQQITTQKAYAGKVVVLADLDIGVGDCRIEWADGGVDRNLAATMKDIEKTVAPARLS